MIPSGPPEVFVPFGREHYARHPGNIQSPGSSNSYFPNVSTASTDAGEDILEAIKTFSILEDKCKVEDESENEDWILRAGSSCEEELYYKSHTVVWSKGQSSSCRHVIMALTIDQPIYRAFWCHFPLSDIEECRNTKTLSSDESLRGIGMVSNSKLNVVTTDGQEFIVPLPFHVNNVWTMKYGLLLQRKLSANSNPNYKDMLPVVFSLFHPLNEATPVVQRSIVGKVGFLNDQHHQIIHAFEDPSIVLTYDPTHKVHTLWKLRLTMKSEEFHTIQNYNQFSTSNSHGQFTPGSTIPSRIVSPLQRSCSPLRNVSSRINSPNIKSRSQSPLLTNLTHMATISRSQSPSATGNNSYGFSQTATPSTSRNGTKMPLLPIMLDKDNENVLRRPLASEICLETVWIEPKSPAIRDGTLSNKSSKVFFTTDLFKQKYFCFLVPTYSHLRCYKCEESDDKNVPILGAGTTISCKDAEGLQGCSLMVVVDIFGNLYVYSGIVKITKIYIPLGPYSTLNLYNSLKREMIGNYRRKSTSHTIVTSSRPPSSLGAPFNEEVNLLSPVPSPTMNVSEMSDSSFELPEGDVSICGHFLSNIISLRDSVDNRISVVLKSGAIHRITIPTMQTTEIVDKALSCLSHVLPNELAMQLYSKWYMTCRATGYNTTTPLQYWNDFALDLLGSIGYVGDRLQHFFCVDSDSSLPNESSIKRFKHSESGSDEDWLYLLRSEHHRFRISDENNFEEADLQSILDATDFKWTIHNNASLLCHLPVVHFALHLLYEDIKLCGLMKCFLPHLAKLLYALTKDLGYENYSDYYWRDFPEVANYTNHHYLGKDIMEKLIYPSFLVSEPPSIFLWLENILLDKPREPFPLIVNINRNIQTIAMLFAVFVQRDFSNVLLENYLNPVVVHTGTKSSILKHLKTDLDFSNLSNPWCETVVMLMIKLGVTLNDLNVIPSSITLPLYEAINKCRNNPPPDWSAKAYILIGREDLAAQIDSPKVVNTYASHNDERMPVVSETKKTIITREDLDGMEHIVNDPNRLHFSQDMKLQEVQRLLQSSKPARVAIVQRSEVNDQEFLEEQERHLYAICIRTMALLVGRGMFTLSTSKPVVTETLQIPNLCLTGRAPPRNTAIDLSHIDVPTNMNMWPLFHNGVAAGLRLAPNASDIDSTWIIYNKPRGNVDIPVEHAGFLMAMGLNGHLKNLDPMNIFNYAVKGNEMTIVGLLLGIAATKRGTMDLATTKLLSIHVEALLPPSSTELDIPHIVQVAAVLGVGLVYQGSAHRHMAEVLISEIGRPPGPEMENSSDCESYSVSAGLALGLIMLGKGTNVAGLSDLGMADLLYHYMVGGPKRPLTGFAKERYKSPSYQIKEGDAINVDVTSPGATLALGFMFFGTNDSTVAQWMTAPDTQHLLDFVRPDFLLLRTLSKGLIMWDSIVPSAAWVESHVPKIISSNEILRGSRDSYVDMETLSQAYCNIISGACMALGLRFAGSANQEAYKTLLKYARTFIGLSGKTAAEQAGRTTVETSINVVLLSLATVMAGSGDLEVLRLCRHLHARVSQSHGFHMATHMAIGLLFLGGGRYTLNNSKQSVAALVCAFFPKFPTHSNDNRYHLQALRHLYVLAVEPRLIIPIDIENGQPCYNHMSVVFKATKWYNEKTILFKVPKLLPQLDLLSEVRVDDPRYWPVTFRCDKNWNVLKSRLEKVGSIFVKRRTGCLSYAEDPNGFKSLLAQSLVKDKSGKWAARPKAIEALTSDKTVLNIANKYLQTFNNSTPFEIKSQSILNHIVYECVTQEKLDVVANLAAIMKLGISVMTSIDIWEVRLISSYLESRFCVGQSLINEESFRAFRSQIDKEIEIWVQEHKSELKKYFTEPEVQDLPKGLIPALIRYSLPSSSKLRKLFLVEENSISLPKMFIELNELHLPLETIIKLHGFIA